MIIFISVILGLLIFVFLFLVQNKKVRKISFRNLFRKKTQTVLIILGSMIGTAMITGSLGLNDSMSLFLFSQIKNELGPIDEIIYKNSEENYLSFDKALGDEFKIKALSNPFVDGAINAFYKSGTLSFNKAAIKNPLTDLSVRIIAFDFNELIFFDISDVQTEKYIFSSLLKEKLKTNGESNLYISEVAETIFDISKKKSEVTNYTLNEKIPRLNLLSDDLDNTYTVFIDIEEFYRLFPENFGETNLILISNTGDWLKGRNLTSSILTFFQNTYLSQKGFIIEAVKEKSIKEAGNANIGYLFLFLSSFSILSGVFLMISTYSMMAKEREVELGMLRAIGYYKSDIRKMFLFEGIFYSILSTLLGVFVGMFLSKFILSNITGFVLNLSNKFLNALGSNFFSMTEIPEFDFYISNQNIILSFTIGIFISLLLILFYSKKLSDFNIVNAVRGVEENSTIKQKKKVLIRLSLFLCSIPLIIWGSQSSNLSMVILGLVIFIIGLTLKYQKKNKLISNVLIISLIISSIFLKVDIFNGINEVLFILLFKPILLLISLSILFMRNFEFMKALSEKRPFKKIIDPFITKISFAYPNMEKRKTRLIIAVYSLVIFIIVIVTIIPHSQMIGIRQSKETLFWGYDAFIPGFFNSNTVYKDELKQKDFITDVQEIKAFNMMTNKGRYRAFLINPDFVFYETKGKWFASSEYQTFTEALEYLKKDKKSYIVITGRENNPTETGSLSIELTEGYQKLGTFFFNNISFFQGILLSNSTLLDKNDYDTYDLIKISGDNKVEIEKNQILFKNYIETNGIFNISNNDVVEISEIAIKGMVKILNGFLYFGMIIGIMGISITMYRAFYDRKKTIGMLKAIGFSKGQIFKSFLIETSIIVITGLLIGLLSGIITAGQINSIFSQLGAPGGDILHIPWFEIIMVVSLFYISSIISVFLPSYNASKIKPAEALKTLE